VNFTFRPRLDRLRRSVFQLIAAVGGSFVLALAGWVQPASTPQAEEQGSSTAAGSPSAVSQTAGSPFTLMQMNLCLSGLAGCYGKAAYPAVVREAVVRIRRARPRAVTFNEACRRDAVRIARRTDYHLRFSRVIYRGERLPCVRPGGRGLFGNAVLTKAPIGRTTDRAFRAQSGIEQRRWLCVTTRVDLDVCTTHLNTRSTQTSTATNDAQCRQLGAILARRSAARAVAFGGDVNRIRSCAPRRVWSRTDRSARQAPGVQHVYGSRAALRSPSARVVPARRSDHDVLLVRARLVPH
jgi:endonuclease/exonuclease/phosphatase family metal-dependent hydrolase